MKKTVVGIALLILLLGVSDWAVAANVTVDSHDMPWLWNTTTLNSSFQFGVQDGVGPAIVDASSGFSFAPGGTFTASYISGRTSAGVGFAFVDANGDTTYVFDNLTGSSGKVAPSAYMPSSTYPIYLMELVGTFADSSGNIVGTPFKIGDGPTSFTVPSGATRLQLGVNDDIFADNSGSLLIAVSGPLAGVPEPSTVLLLGLGIVGLAGARRYRK